MVSKHKHHSSLSKPHGRSSKEEKDSQIGRWTHEEHMLFLDGLRLYGKAWKKISKLVKTRSLVQIRSHAQKYFQKLQQASDAGQATPDDELLMDGKRMSISHVNKKKGSLRARRACLVRKRDTSLRAAKFKEEEEILNELPTSENTSDSEGDSDSSGGPSDMVSFSTDDNTSDNIGIGCNELFDEKAQDTFFTFLEDNLENGDALSGAFWTPITSFFDATVPNDISAAQMKGSEWMNPHQPMAAPPVFGHC